jgi:hypothetical protein
MKTYHGGKEIVFLFVLFLFILLMIYFGFFPA